MSDWMYLRDYPRGIKDKAIVDMLRSARSATGRPATWISYADTNGVSKQRLQSTFQVLLFDIPSGAFADGVLDHRGARHLDRLISRSEGVG